MPIPALAVTPPPMVDRSVFSVTVADRVGRSITLDTSGRLGAGYVLRPGVTGMDMPPLSLSSDALPDEDGSILRALRFVERDVFLPVWVSGRSYADQRNKVQALLSILNPRKSSDPYDPLNMVDVIVDQPDGARRTASGYYVGGTEGSYNANDFGIEWRVLGATVRCLDPYVYGDVPTPLPFRLAAASQPFIDAAHPFLPFQLGSSQVLGSATINNAGDVDAFVVWTLNGPATSFTVTNTTTGRTFTYTASVSGAGAITVDTRRSMQSVKNQAGANVFANLTGDMWPLVPGVNTITLTVPGATTSTLLSATVYTRYLSF